MTCVQDLIGVAAEHLKKEVNRCHFALSLFISAMLANSRVSRIQISIDSSPPFVSPRDCSQITFSCTLIKRPLSAKSIKFASDIVCLQQVGDVSQCRRSLHENASCNHPKRRFRFSPYATKFRFTFIDRKIFLSFNFFWIPTSNQFFGERVEDVDGFFSSWMEQQHHQMDETKKNLRSKVYQRSQKTFLWSWMEQAKKSAEVLFFGFLLWLMLHLRFWLEWNLDLKQ